MVTRIGYRLAGPKGRRYTFEPLPNNHVKIRRFEGLTVVSIRIDPAPRARSLWTWLRRLGYVM